MKWFFDEVLRGMLGREWRELPILLERPRKTAFFFFFFFFLN
eukprot:SAG11_NODE_6803_length_1245_cov_2.014834_1_plen_41_part_10